MATYQDLSRLSTYNTQDRKVRPVGIVFHHTNSRTTNPGTIRILNERKDKHGNPQPLGSNFVMDREGNIAYGVAPGAYAAHMRPSPDGYYTNSNMLGLEVSAIDDSDIRQDQIDAAVKWAADMGMTYGFDPGKTAFGHGEVNPGHKLPTEGYTIANAVRQHHPQTQQEALMSPARMANQYAPDFGMWAAPSAEGVTPRPVRATRERGVSVSPTMPGAINPSRGSFAPAGENRWPDEVHAFPEGGSGFSRGEMFALGRDPRFRQLAIEMLTGRMTPSQRVALAHASVEPFVPTRMAADADYQTVWDGRSTFGR